MKRKRKFKFNLKKFLIGCVKLLGLIMLLVIPHELGHAFFMQVFGLQIKELSLGFGKLLAQTNIGDTLLSLRAIPLGGYAEAVSEFDLPLLQFLIMVSAGGAINLITASLLKTRWKNTADIIRFNGWANLLPIFPMTDGSVMLRKILLTIGVNKGIIVMIMALTSGIIVAVYLFRDTFKQYKRYREESKRLDRKIEQLNKEIQEYNAKIKEREKNG